MRQSRLSGSVEGVMGNHDSYSDIEFEAASRVIAPSRNRLAFSTSVYWDLSSWVANCRTSIGMSVGLLVAGPLTDRIGRRNLMMIGVA